MSVEYFRERIDTASTIKSILDTYPTTSVLRELIQNSDDAGATTQSFIIDFRQHGQKSVADEALKRTQGPALLAVNNSIFTESDWLAVRTIHGSNKSADETKTGKYGLGIRACYHAQILSHGKLAIFDPHEEFKDHPGGLRLSLPQGREVHEDQFEAFSAAYLSTNPSYLDSTVVRLPLRTPPEAARSRIKPIVVTPSDIKALFDSFIDNELSVALLFLKNILSIELREITAEGRDIVIARSSITSTDGAGCRPPFPLAVIDDFKSYELNVSSIVRDAPPTSTTWTVAHSVLKETSVHKSMNMQLQYDVGDRLIKDKLSSHVSLAYHHNPPQSTVGARLFTLLPLPILTGFPLHINGVFALTPDRQNLRNPNELGIGLEARERLLITWNSFIFQDLVPLAWVKLIHVLINQGFSEKDIWSVWPPASPLVVQSQLLLDCFTKLALSHDEELFPSKLNDKCEFIRGNQPALVVSPFVDQELIRAVSLLGIAVVTPPSSIYEAFERCDFGGSAFRLFNPENLANSLTSESILRDKLDPTSNSQILDYIISVSPSLLIGLPLIPTVTPGLYISLSRPSMVPYTYILCSSVEAMLFRSCDSLLIDLSQLTYTSRHQLENCAKDNLLNVAHFGPGNLEAFLRIICGEKPEVFISFPPTLPPDWLATFWSWMDSHASHGPFFEVAWRYHLLPTVDSSVRRTSETAFIVPSGRHELYVLLKEANVPFLHPDVTSTCALSASDAALSIDSISRLISFIEPERIRTQPNRLMLQNYIRRCMHELDSVDYFKFRSLPIFPNRVPNPHSPYTPVTVLDTAIGHLKFIAVPDDFPLPVVDGITFIDISGPHYDISSRINPDANYVLREKEVLELAIEQFSVQPEALRDALMLRVMRSLQTLDHETQNRVRSLKFVPVMGSSERLAPKDVIDPKSSLKALFKDENGCFPSKPYASGEYFDIMRFRKLFCSQLTSEHVTERIRYLSSGTSGHEKARVFLRVLEEQWNPAFTSILQTDADVCWIPTVTSSLVSRQFCQDVHTGEHHFLFDLVHSQCANTVSNDIRIALGWCSPIDFDVLRKQLSLTLNFTNASERSKRLLCLVKYLAKFRSNSSDMIKSLQEVVRNTPWIPLASGGIGSTEHALLNPDIKVGKLFQSVSLGLLNSPGADSFLRLMGCTDRPTVDSLIGALEVSESLDDSVDILKELAYHKNDFTGDQRAKILVPDDLGTMRPLSEIYLSDIKDRQNDFRKTSIFPAHPSISQLVAQRIGLTTLSSLRLNDENNLDIDDEDMSEEFVTRIKSVLVEYDIQYSLGEFLANAADAGATEFQILLDRKPEEQPFSSTQILCPQMTEFQEEPALLLYNNAEFSENDFKGLRRIGEGGKQNMNDSIGKFGLGALSFYHFAEVAFILSGQYLMILDPSGLYLPKRHGQKFRRCFWRRLEDVYRIHSDILKPFEGLFDFQCEMRYYHGTIIRLPLRKRSSQISESKLTFLNCYDLVVGPYMDLAKDATHFTRLQKISALRRDISDVKEPVLLWSITHNNHTKVMPTHADIEARLFSLAVESPHNRTSVFEQWLVVHNSVPLESVPEDFHLLLRAMKVSNGVDIALAFQLQLDSDTGCRQNYLFSGLRIPQTVSFPAHAHASFAISNDRRSIRFDSPDSSGERILQSQYNLWILSYPLVELYINAFRYLFQESPAEHTAGKWWPVKLNDPITKEFANSFYQDLPKTSVPVLPTVTNHLVPLSEAIVSSDSVPKPIHDLLVRLRANSFVFLLPSVMALLPQEFHLIPESLVRLLKEPKVERRLQACYLTLGVEINATVDFLLRDEFSGGHSLPLLVTKDNQLKRFDSQLTYISHQSFPNELFPHNRFISTTIYTKSSLLRLMRMSSYQVNDFGEAAFLTFLSERDKFSLIKEYPLFPTLGKDSKEYASLMYCRAGGVIPPLKSDLDGEFSAILSALGISVLVDHPKLRDADKQLKFSLSAFLDCLGHHQINDFSGLTQVQAELLAEWMIRQTPIELAGLNKKCLELLSRLPLWNSARDGRILRLSAIGLDMLPSDLELVRVLPFLHPHKCVTEYSGELLNLWGYLGSNSRNITSYLDLPNLLNLVNLARVDDLPNYHYLIRQLILHSVPALKIPDGACDLRPAAEFFHASVELFTSAFFHDQEVKFVHPVFRDLQDQLPVKQIVTPELFKDCAQAINDDQLNGRTLEILPRARMIYRYYNDVLPQLLMSNPHHWRPLESICFVPRNRRPIEQLGFDSNAYIFPHFDDIVPPLALIDERYQPIAWTQRARFEVPPSANLQAVNRYIGVPTAAEVVQHLFVLATRVAKDHPHNSTVANHLQETYKWLYENADEAAAALELHRNNPIFLNVVNIRSCTEPWVWRSANELVLGPVFDYTHTFKVETFLAEFSDLLRAAGVQEIRDGHHANEAYFGDPDFNRLRTAGKLLDIELRPEDYENNEVPDSVQLKAHSVFLAAKVPHIETALTGGWSESRDRFLSFPGSYFAARAFLELLYVGDLSDERPNNPEDSFGFLDVLFQMLKVTDMWDLPRLKRKIGWLITVKYTFMHPDTISSIQESAVECHASELTQACNEWISEHAKVLELFNAT
ncbi:hypothetical protein BDP27DRAFT_1314095 [Rhodocollybia butyracea]|uniref:Sacsin/Nov domain-containing protein n=1 Tax=Rhodocollybia butyracea TaxID=206335 RepID=A0A9P5UDH2_9AGAR|nr:hypothetical protein BDP27DRAFT_1314095 [Rhodocollybia butyracea]